MAKKKNQNTSGAQGTAGKNVGVVFNYPAFSLENVKYDSKVVEEAAANGDAAALEVITKLINMGSGVITVTEGGE